MAALRKGIVCPLLALNLNLFETIKVSETYAKRKADEVTNKPKIFMSDLEYYGPEMPVVNKVCDYSPRSTNRMFKISLLAN